MKIAIIGATGLLGTELAQYFESRGDTVVALASSDCDVTDPHSVHAALTLHRPDLVINCAAMLDVDACEANQDRCYAVNRDGVRNLLEAVRSLGNPLVFVQIGSSEIFGRVSPGEYNIGGYREKDLPAPVSAYQRSKKEAEDVLTSFASEHPKALKAFYIARAGWLYGEGRATFIDRFVELLKSKEPLTVIKDQWRSPTWTRDFAKSLAFIIDEKLQSGIYHLTAEVKYGEATTMDVIEEINRHLGREAVHPPITFTTQAAFFKVPRAPSNVLINTKLPKLPYWRDSLREYLSEKYPL